MLFQNKLNIEAVLSILTVSYFFGMFLLGTVGLPPSFFTGLLIATAELISYALNIKNLNQPKI